MSSIDPADISVALKAVATGDRLALARALSVVDRRHCVAPNPLSPPPSFGITGAPGAGKSTLINAIIAELRARDLTVGALLVDPSHPKTGGALLGDRIRMSAHNHDNGVFIRSLGSRGSGTGISTDLAAMINVMGHCPFDILLVETVGVGQLDTAISDLVDKVVMLSPPGCGDEIQAMKASNLDIADAIVINKADMPEREVQRHESSLRLHAEICAGPVAPVFKTIATTGEGVGLFVEEFLLRSR